jgi:hypothetical protein
VTTVLLAVVCVAQLAAIVLLARLHASERRHLTHAVIARHAADFNALDRTPPKKAKARPEPHPDRPVDPADRHPVGL